MGTDSPGGRGEDRSFRDVARDLLIEAFGEPRVMRAEEGALYRWVLKRERGLSLYVTLDSPEMPWIAHLLISDPEAEMVDPIATVTMRTVEEIRATIEAIRRQWER
jgi:hypothetical protein